MIHSKSRQRLLSALKHKRVDKVPWTALVTEYYLNSLPKLVRLHNSFDLLQYVRADPVELSNWQLADWAKRVGGTDFNVIVERRANQSRTVIETPVGQVSQMDVYEPVADTTFRKEYFIKTAADCRVMQYIYEKLMDKPDFGRLKRTIDGLHNDGLLLYFAIRSPLQMLLEELAGVETTLLLLHDESIVVRALLMAIHAQNKEKYRSVAESTLVEIAISIEDTTTTIISPAIFEKHIVPYLNDYAAILHKNGILFGAHMCGHIKDLLPLIRQTDLDGIESVTPPPLGDTDLHYAREVLGSNFFLMGGLSAPFVKESLPEQIKAAVKEILGEFKGEKGLIIEVTDDVSPGTPLENLQVIREAIEQHA